MAEDNHVRVPITNVQLSGWRRQDLLTPHEEQELVAQCRMGNRAARDKLIVRSMRLVLSLADDYADSDKQLFLDLVSEGALGLNDAVDRFDPERGYRFSTLATHYIRSAMSLALPHLLSPIRLPATADIRKLRNAIRDLERKLGRTPSLEELVKDTGIHAARIEDILPSLKVVSLDEPLPDADRASTTRGDMLLSEAPSPYETALKEADKQAVQEALQQLPINERQALVEKFGLDDGDPKSDRAVGRTLGVGNKTVGARLRRALQTLREDPELRETMLGEVGGAEEDKNG